MVKFPLLFQNLPVPLILQNQLPVFNGITDTYRDFISFIFSVERPIENKSKYWGAECFVSSLSKSDFEWFWKGIGGGEKYKLIIYEKTGGYMALIKGTIIDRDILIKAIWGEYASQNI